LKNIAELIVSLAVVAIPVIASFISKSLISSKKAVALVEVLEPLAKAAVIAAEQLGVSSQLSGAVKKSTAIANVKASLDSMGFTKADEQTIANAVEKAYADTTQQLAETYKEGSHETH
jgi:LL-H family phage holin